ncbi:hypothetical protein WMY93_021053 [Mugilogobius chulae]|uniref:NF-kappa-B inhibitor-like protein 1 n=1 Tax=Mugilogobius chulae TaxID=88201 RepID=A0AAW0NLU9_9GOBI
MFVPNRAGVTPEDLLNWMKQTEPSASTSHRSEKDPEKEWMEKLFDECEDEFFESFGVYDADDFLPVDDDDEDFGDWADRIRREYFDKKHAEAQRLAASCSGSKRRKTNKEREQEEKSHKEHLRRLQKEHEEYLSRATRKEDEVRQGKKRRYEERCAATFQASSSSSVSDSKLCYSDIPGQLHEELKDVNAFRKVLRKQQTLWHPDKFAQRCSSRLEEKDRQRILDTVTALSQELNSLAQSLKT